MLRPHQRPMVDFIIDHPRANCFAPMGSGKTYATLTALDALSLTEDVFPALVVAPLRVARTTWPDEVRKWPELSHLRVSVITGAADERRNALATRAQVYTTNYENLPWLVEHLGDAWPFKTVICDESSKLKGHRLRGGSKRAAALAKRVHRRTRRYLGLTGTPAPNGLLDLWGQQWFVDAGLALGKSFSGFRSRWFDAVRVGEDPHAIKYVPLPGAQRQIEAAIKPTSFTLDMRDWFDLKAPIVTDVEVDMPPSAAKLYDEMAHDLYVEIMGQGVEAANVATKSMKCLQIAGGALYTDDACTQYATVHTAKLDALEDIVEEAAGAPVLVAYQFRHELDRLLTRFPQARELDANPQTIRDWNDGAIPVLLAHPASAGHGLNLQDGGNILVYFSHWWNLEERMQIAERIGPLRQLQAGHDRPVFIYNLIARDTLDRTVIERDGDKQSVQQSLLDAMKRRFGGAA